MSTWAIIATGESMSQALADSVRHLHRVVINTAYELAPDADALAANDAAFWSEYPEARQFAGRRFTAWRYTGVETLQSNLVGPPSISGVLALEVAIHLGATRCLLLGFDCRGGHFHGDYRGRAKRSTPTDWNKHRNQFKAWQRARPAFEVLNCTPESALDVFPRCPLDDAIALA